MEQAQDAVPSQSTRQLVEQAQLDARAIGYAHRMAIAKRFAQRIEVGDAVFITGKAANMDLPHTISGGKQRPITGFNRWMLLQVMQDRAWSDARFFTSKQLETFGWNLRDGAQPVVLQFVSTTDQDGTALAIPKVQRLSVFNATFIDGVPASTAAVKFSSKALESAMVAADFEPGAQIVDALAAWVDAQYAGLGGREGKAPQALAQALAMSAVFAEIEWDDGQHGKALKQHARRWSSAEWVRDAQALINTDPTAFFDAVRVAELAASQVVSMTRIAQQELQASHEILATRKEAAMDNYSSIQSPGGKGRSSYQERLEEMFAARQAVLAVPYKEKDRAKQMGAVFYGNKRKDGTDGMGGVWFVPQGLDVCKFKQWDPRQHCLSPTATEGVVIDAFIQAMAALNLEEPKEIKADGQWHNVRVTDKKGRNLSGAYLLNLETASGQINNKYSGQSMSWIYDGPLLTPEQRARMRALTEQRAKEADAARQKAQETAAEHAAEIVAQGQPAHGHGYVQKKGMSAEGLVQVPGKVLLKYDEFYGESGMSAIREDQNYLIVPMKNAAGQIRAVQAINEDGSVKSFMRGGQKKGTMAVLGAPSLDALFAHVASQPNRIWVASFTEGCATGDALRSGSNTPVIVCFDAGNLEAVVSENAHKIPPNLMPILAVDNDQFHVERALGFLARELGVNPNSQRGSMVEVLSGQTSTRMVSLGDAIANDDWNQAPKGRYQMKLVRESDSTEVRSIELEAMIDGEVRARRMTFSNRGVEAGRTALEILRKREQGHTSAVMLVPEFKSLQGRPTDWNDMAKLHGHGEREIARQFLGKLMEIGAIKEAERPIQPAMAQAAGRAKSGMQR